MSLTKAQRDILLTGIKPDRVKTDNKGMSYLEGYEIIAHLNRVFGFDGWDKHVTSLEQVFEHGDPELASSRWTVCYRATVRLVINGGEIIKEDASTGSAQNQPSRADAHDLAVKSAVTGALKRAAVDLGDQFGLSLYRKGSTDPLVKRVIPYEVVEKDA